MTIKLICSDCNGVLNNVDGDYSKTGWYSTILQDNYELYNKISKFLFRSGKNYFINSWMSGEINYKDINSILAINFDTSIDYLNKKLIDSAAKLELNWKLVKTYQYFREKGLKIFITTNNMDIFSLYTVPAQNLNNYFDKIYNSFDINLIDESN